MDSDLAKNLAWILENDVADLCLDFSYETQILGHTVTKELVPDGFSVEVDDTNKKQYVVALCEALMTKEIENQLEAFLRGFRAVLPARFLAHLSPSDLGLLISGTPIIDLEDMKMNCRYEYFEEDTDVAVWFWQVVSEFNQEGLASLIYFVSGSLSL